jgi:plastocyanin
MIATARRLGALAAIAVLALALSGAPASGRATKTVEVGDDFFGPTSLSINTGTKVAFNWTGEDKHDVVKKKGPGPSFSSSRTRADGVNLTHKFTKPGTYRIICTVHDSMKMTIDVG